MSTQADGRSRSLSLKPLPEANFRAIQRVQNRLDEAEAELAAVVSLAQRRGTKYLHEMAEPLLDELGELLTQLRSLMLEPDARGSGRTELRPAAPAARVMAMTPPAAQRRSPGA